MNSGEIKAILVLIAMVLPFAIPIVLLIRCSFYDTLRDLGYSDKEIAGWGSLPDN